MRKSVPAFVFGLIGSLFSLWWGFLFGIVGDAAGAIIAIGTGDASALIVVMILGWLAFIGAIIGIIGASSCFKKAKKGAIILLVATIMCSALLIYVFIKSLAGGGMVPTMVILFLLPVVLLVVSVVCAFTAKPVETQINGYYNPNFNQPNIEPNKTTQTKSLEEELTELKSMFDKQLLTTEEYAQAKKNVIEKHSK